MAAEVLDTIRLHYDTAKKYIIVVGQPYSGLPLLVWVARQLL